MSHLQKVSYLLGALLLGISAALVLGGNEKSPRRPRRTARTLPVEQLAENLKQAWAPYHTP
ncbi:MAG: hypothetical protein M3Y57_03455 [Acidobacteriota bacterium]|nr:hypothetical protein [Acidobacteriota bacterium]